jgi:predicted kinase
MKPLAPTTPHLIILMGIPGAGKTQFAEHFTKMFHAPYVNAHTLQVLAGADDAKTEDLALHMVSEIAKAQRTFVYEGPTYSRAHRQSIAKIVHEAKLKPLLVWVQTDSTEAKKRVQRQRMYTSEEFETMLAKFQVPLAVEKPIVISGKHTFATQVKMVLKHIATGSRVNSPEFPKPAPRSGRIISIR